LVLRLSKQWGPAQAIIDIVGATPLTYVLEAVAVYIGAQIMVLMVRMFSSTLYRLLRMILLILVVSGGVMLGLYMYFTSTISGQQQARVPSNQFWVNQAMALVGHLAPAWDARANGNPGQRPGPPPVNFQYQPPNYH
ncbi:hypothetical protein IWW51_003411, partial [Coemansia sp. RSA 2702]